MKTTIRHLTMLAILLMTGSTGMLCAQDSVSLSITFDLIDVAPPTVTVTDVDPALRSTVPDPIRFTFSEPVMNLDSGDFVLTRDGSPIALSGALLSQISPTVYDLDLGTIPIADGDYVLTLPTSSNVTDRFSKPLVADASTAWTMDTVEPLLIAAVTRDSDADGRIDRIDLQFNKNIRDASLDRSDFAVAGYTLVSVTSGSTVDDPNLTLIIAEGATADTDATPGITYTANGTTDLRDLVDIPVADFATTATDGAGPAIISAATVTTGSVEIVFSEAITDSSVALADLTISGFATTAANGAPIAWSTVTIDDDRLHLDLAALIDEDDTGYVALSGSIDDASANPSLQTAAIPISDGIAPGPALLSATTADDDGNGSIDRLRLVFAGPVDIADGNAADTLTGLSINGYTVLPADYVLSNGTILDLALQESDAPDSGVRPRIDWAHAGTVRDSSTGARSPIVDQLLSDDGAAPVLLAASARIGQSTIGLTFSEPIQAVSPPIGTADIAYSNGSGSDNNGLGGITDQDGSDAEIAFNSSSPLAFDDFGNDSLNVVLGRLSDSAGNLAVGREQTLREEGAQPGLDPIAAQVIAEDSGLLRIALSGLRPSSNGSTIVVQTSSSDSGLTPPPQVTNYDPLTRSAELVVAPVGNANGSASLRLRVSDDTGAWIERSFTLTVTAVNDPPRMDAIANRAIDEDSATLRIPITGLAPGPANESTQGLTLSAFSLNSALVSQIQVDHVAGASTAELAVTPAADATGPVMIVVRAQDDGVGQLQISRSFTLTLNPIDDAPRLVASSGMVNAVGSERLIGSNRLNAWDDGDLDLLRFIIADLPVAGEIRRDGVALASGEAFSQRDLDNGLISYRHTGSVPVFDGFTFSLRDDGDQSGGDGHLFAIDVVDPGSAPGSAPVVTIDTSDLTWVEGNPPVVLDPTLLVVDADGSLANGLVVVEISAGAQTDDLLDLSSGSGITLDGTRVLLDGAYAADIVLSASPPKLQLLLGSNATPAGVQRLLRAVTYQNTGSNPGSGTRTVQVILDDGAGRTSTPVGRNVLVTDIDSPPQITMPSGIATFVEDGADVLLDPAATIIDPDSTTLSGGSLSLQWTSGAGTGEQLFIDAAGGPEGRVALAGSTVTVDASPVATISGGSNGTPLLLSLDPATTPAQATQLLRAIAFRQSDAEPSPGLRQLSVTITDGSAGSDTATATVQVTGSNDAPVITIPASLLVYEESDPAIALAAPTVVTDADSADFAGGLLRLRITAGGGPNDQLLLADNGSITVAPDGGLYQAGLRIGSASIDSTSISVLFEQPIDAATVAEAFGCLRFSNSSSSPTPGIRSLAFTLTDGDGGQSATVTRDLDVRDSNAPPDITLSTTAVVFVEDAGPAAVFPAVTITDGDSADFDGGVLSVAITAGDLSQDRLELLNGSGIASAGGSVSVDGTVIASGDATSNTNGILRFTLNAAATPDRCRRLLEAVVFANDSDTPATSARSIAAVISDGDGDTSIARSVALSVSPTNDAPTAIDETIYTLPAMTISGRLTATDPEGDSLTWSIASPPSMGVFTLAADGSYTYRVDGDVSGDDQVQVTVDDGVITSQPATITLRIADLDATSLEVTTSPSPYALLDVQWTYLLQLDASRLGLTNPDCQFQLYGDAPSGLTMEQLGPLTVELRWLPGVDSRETGVHYRFGLLFTERGSGLSGIVPILISISPTNGGNQ